MLILFGCVNLAMHSNNRIRMRVVWILISFVFTINSFWMILRLFTRKKYLIYVTKCGHALLSYSFQTLSLFFSLILSHLFFPLFYISFFYKSHFSVYCPFLCALF